MFVDTHCHLNMMAVKNYGDKFELKDLDIIKDIIIRSQKTNVNKFLTVGTSLQDSNISILISKNFEQVYSVIGIHPCDSENIFDLSEIEKLIVNKKENKIVGIGETGLDFYHKPYDKVKQINFFEKQIELSIKYKLPLVIHVRESVQEVFDILKTYKNNITGVIHCFSQDKEYAKKFLDLNFYLGIGAIITYPKNNYLREIVNFMPLNRILLETDAPFLPPQEFRGKQNSPEYIPITAQAVALAKNIDIKEVEVQTTQNAIRLFNAAGGSLPLP
ncbi:MAG: Mg-dependent DNase [candidate division TM6 bacterium GW2011_GWF2_28_16]|nr:MAG: Mg-dependent DNase [candidate division TM6 bacterium GW2011_GWF2_28_16]